MTSLRGPGASFRLQARIWDAVAISGVVLLGVQIAKDPSGPAPAAGVAVETASPCNVHVRSGK